MGRMFRTTRAFCFALETVWSGPFLVSVVTKAITKEVVLPLDRLKCEVIRLDVVYVDCLYGQTKTRTIHFIYYQTHTHLAFYP